MPELPEVETARRRAQRALRGRRIREVAVVDDPIVYDGVSPARFAATLRGRRVLAVHRKGKHLWMELDRPPFPLFHFGMTGSFEIYRDVAARPRFWKVEIAAEDGTRLAMPDPRRLGRIRLRRDPEAEPPLARLGFDVLRGLPPARELARLLARRGAPAKAVLLDQSVFAGVGNWIADEALYQAAIDPRRPASSLSLKEVARLRSRLHAIVRLAVDAGADEARYPRTWLFHDRWGRAEGARTARGEPIVHVTIGGRTTAVVPERYGLMPLRGTHATSRKARRAPAERSLKRAAGR
jgi:formamidopyrimidine-DNA glycosylase